MPNFAHLFDRKTARRLAAVAITAASLTMLRPSTAFAEIWTIAPGSVICEGYFSVKDAEAAASLSDQKWLDQLGCIVSRSGFHVRALLDGNISKPWEVWRVRLSMVGGDRTVFLRGSRILRDGAPAAASGAFNNLINGLENPGAQGPASFDGLLKNLTRQQVAKADDARAKASDLDALRIQLTQQLYPCWNVPAGARDAKDLNIEVRVTIDPDGTARQATIVSQSRMNDPLYRATAESARRTFFNSQCTPLRLPPDQYQTWKEITVHFDPKDLL